MKISIRSVLIVMMVLLAIVSCVIMGVLIGQAGIHSAQEGADLLRKEVVARKQLEVLTYFRRPMAALTAIESAARITGTFNYKDVNTFQYWICAMTAKNDYRDVYVGLEDSSSMWGYVTGPTSVCDVWVGNADHNNATVAVVNFTDHRTPHLVSPHVNDGTNDYDPRVRPWYNDSRYEMAWSRVYLNWQSTITALTLGAPVYQPEENRRVGVFATDLTTTDLLNHFSKVVIAKTGKMILVESATRHVIGATWNESVVYTHEKTDCGTHKNETCTEFEMATLRTLKEPLLVDAVRSLGEDYLYSCKNNASSTEVLCDTSYGSGRDRVLVDVVGVQDSYGLDLRLIIMVPERDFLGEVWSRSDLAIIVAAVVVVTLISLSVVIVYFVLRPLQRVEARLYQAATLEDQEDEEEAESIFAEVAGIQAAFNAMTVELKRIRSYVPQSLLRTLDNLDDEDDEFDEGSAVENSRGHSDTASRKSTASSVRSRSTRAATVTSTGSTRGAIAAGRTLHTAMSLAQRRVTVLVVNLSGFHKASTSVTPSELLDKHSTAMKHIHQVVSGQKGVLDAFSGDHFTLTFNAVTNCASHAARAAACVMQIQEKVKDANFGVSTGLALCGNMGIDAVKRFSIVGPVVNQAYALERLCKLVRVPSLVALPSYEVMMFEYHMEFVEVVHLPFASRPTPIATICASKKAGVNDEWMYVLKNQDQDATKLLEANEAYMQYCSGNLDSAKEILQEVPESSQHNGAKTLREMLSTPPDEWVKRLGAFYTVALSGASLSFEECD